MWVTSSCGSEKAVYACINHQKISKQVLPRSAGGVTVLCHIRLKAL